MVTIADCYPATGQQGFHLYIIAKICIWDTFHEIILPCRHFGFIEPNIA